MALRTNVSASPGRTFMGRALASRAHDPAFSRRGRAHPHAARPPRAVRVERRRPLAGAGRPAAHRPRPPPGPRGRPRPRHGGCGVGLRPAAGRRDRHGHRRRPRGGPGGARPRPARARRRRVLGTDPARDRRPLPWVPRRRPPPTGLGARRGPRGPGPAGPPPDRGRGPGRRGPGGDPRRAGLRNRATPRRGVRPPRQHRGAVARGRPAVRPCAWASASCCRPPRTRPSRTRSDRRTAGGRGGQVSTSAWCSTQKRAAGTTSRRGSPIGSPHASHRP